MVAEAEAFTFVPPVVSLARPKDRRLMRLLKAKDEVAHRIVQGPATVSRASRRAIGLWGSIWKWDVNQTEMQRTFVPRYIRRHYTADVPKTRRARRHRAVILRVSRAKGIIR